MIPQPISIKNGDNVMLKSGGPIMKVARVYTITNSRIKHAVCKWRVKREWSYGDFPLTSLDKI